MPPAFKGDNINKMLLESSQMTKKEVMICLLDDDNNSDDNKSDNSFVAPDSEGSEYLATSTPVSNSNNNL